MQDKFLEFCEIIKKLRDPIEGCPWDKEQTNLSLKKYILEEAYEVVEAIETNNFNNLKEELGDLLLQIVLQAQIAKENEVFDINDVIEGIKHKIIYRHPHVFNQNKKIENPKDVELQWEKLKEKEKNNTSLLDNIPQSLPALKKAYKLQEKAAKLGFDWDNLDGVIFKIEEELNEFLKALKNNDKQDIFEELGDLLFSIVNLSRWLDIDPEDALNSTNKKFINRFKWMENKLDKKDIKLSIQEWDALWEEAKQFVK